MKSERKRIEIEIESKKSELQNQTESEQHRTLERIRTLEGVLDLINTNLSIVERKNYDSISDFNYLLEKKRMYENIQEDSLGFLVKCVYEFTPRGTRTRRKCRIFFLDPKKTKVLAALE